MLAKAVQQHTAAPPPYKPPTLSQQLFPSSSPSASQDAFRNGPQRFSTPQLSHQATASKNILKPSTSSTLNGPRGDWRFEQANALRRPLPQSSSIPSFNRQDPLSSKVDVVDLTQPSGDGGRVGKLHDAVYFDENDFDDDTDLDLDIEDPCTKGYPSTVKLEQSLSTQTKTSVVPKQQSTTSQPVPWSSSPLYHNATPPNAGLLQRPVPLPDSGRQNSVDAPISRPNKRRTLPWLDTPEQNTTEGPPSYVQKITDRKRKNFHVDNGVESFTPLPKDKPNSPYPWNKTASAVKEEQKRLRQANKKLIKTLEGDDVSIGNASATKKNAVARVFLSDEQRKVLKMVADEKRSVFFTGSAGMSLLFVEYVS